MGIYLNSKSPSDAYKAAASEKYFVDKSALIAELIPALGTSQRFFCITRPRRFGKSVMADMVAAFFGKKRIQRNCSTLLRLRRQEL